jgi:hypothetical protein
VHEDVVLHPRDNVVFDSVSLPGYVFEDGLGVIYVVGDGVFESGKNITWLGDSVSVTFAVGCMSRPVYDEIFDDWGFGDVAGVARHREFLLPVLAESLLYVGDSLCLNETLFLDSESGFVEDYRVRTVSCGVDSQGFFNITLVQRCYGATVIDSAYLVMGWKRVCDRWRYVKNCIENCGFAGGIDCIGRCSYLADLKCRHYVGDRAYCETPASGYLGFLEDGSSMSWTNRPSNSGGDPCGCRYVWDESSSCINNRISLGDSEIKSCADSVTVYRSLGSDSCEGSFEDLGGSQRVFIRADSGSSVIVSDLAHMKTWFAPAHILYRLGSGGVGDDVFYADFGQDYDSSGYVDFVFLKSYERSMPRLFDGRWSIKSYTGGFLELGYVGSQKDLFEEVIAFPSFSDRLSYREYGVCHSFRGCDVGFVCVDEKCVSADDIGGSRLGSCLMEVQDSFIELIAPHTAEYGSEVTLSAYLSSGGVPVSGERIFFVCGMKSSSSETGVDGLGKLEIVMPRSNLLCTVEYRGGAVYGGSNAEVIISSSSGVDYSFVWPFLGVFFLLAVGFTSLSGGRTLHDLYSTVRGWFG